MLATPVAYKMGRKSTIRMMLRIALARNADRLAVVADDPDAGRDLAGRAPAVEELERHVVREQHEEQRDDHERSHRARSRCGEARRPRAR